MEQNGRFDPAPAVKELQKAISEPNLNKEHVINILFGGDLKERDQIVIRFNEVADVPLEKQLEPHFDETELKIMLPQVQDPIEYYAAELHAAFVEIKKINVVFHTFRSMFGQTEACYYNIANILCTRSIPEIHQLKAVYQQKYEHSIDDDISAKLSEKFRDLMWNKCNPNENETAPFSEVEEAQKLTKETKQDDISEFVRIFGKRTDREIKLIVDEFEKAGVPIESKINSVFVEEDKLGFKVIAIYCKSVDSYFAQCLYDGLTTKNSTLIQLVLLQCADLQKVKEVFESKHGSLQDCMQNSKFSDNYKYVLHTLFGIEFTRNSNDCNLM